VQEILQWKAPKGVAASPATRRSNTAVDPKEAQTFILEGDLWRIATEANDCDFHLELAAPGAGPTADRVVVEVPQDEPYSAIRQAILSHLMAKGAKFGGPVLKKPIRIRVTGYAFYDGSHFSNSDPQRGHDHGTAFVGSLWELHPIGNAEF
jgi:hypothetical protein